MLYPLRLETAELEDGSPAIFDIDLLKKHVRVDSSDEDDLLNIYAPAAVRWIEARTQRTLIRRSHIWMLQDFETCPPYGIRLPRGRTVSVTSVAYSSGGSVVTMTGPSSDPAGTEFQEDLRGDSGGVIMPLRGRAWPSVDTDVPAPVAITFVAGWLADDLPADLRNAFLFAVADSYDIRGSTDLDSGGTRLQARESLISGWALPRIY